jgi:GalNAc-alpha-(1->4)-GalNAc-alpha-(1->3)-diNAcBac-PP-undecaprenol alpha-1,4-N-acetyl-D-galactosaminyltransferase
MRVTFVIPSMTSGGAERALAVIANSWAERGDSVTLLTFDDGATPPFYPLSDRINHLALNLLKSSEGLWDSIQQNLRRAFVLRAAVKSSAPEIVVSFLLRANVRVLLAMIGNKIPIIVSERNDPWLAKPGKVWKRLAKITYPWAAKITVHTKRSAQFFPVSLQRKICVIPNSLLIEAKPKPRTNGQQIIAIGRLEEQKAFDVLLPAFALVGNEFPEAKLTIWGEGSQRKKLESLRASLHLQNRVMLPGVTKNIVNELSKADVFVQSSRWEGFGNALCEAMAIGLPAISTDCSGPQEIIRDGVDGILVPVNNVEALAEAMKQVLSNHSLRAELGKRALEIGERFSLQRMLQQWQEAVDEARTNS